MSEGLGMRYAFLGAFEAAHLNAEGKLPEFLKKFSTNINFHMLGEILAILGMFLIDFRKYGLKF